MESHQFSDYVVKTLESWGFDSKFFSRFNLHLTGAYSCSRHDLRDYFYSLKEVEAAPPSSNSCERVLQSCLAVIEAR